MSVELSKQIMEGYHQLSVDIDDICQALNKVSQIKIDSEMPIEKVLDFISCLKVDQDKIERLVHDED